MSRKKKINQIIKCACGCGKTRFLYDRKGRERKFINNHDKSIGAKGFKIERGYKLVKCPTEFIHLTNKQGYVREHRLIWQQNNPTIRLTLEQVIHHIDKIKLNNEIKNLENKTNGEHITLHKTKDLSNRVCLLCESPRSSQDWYKFKDGFICKKCYNQRRLLNIKSNILI
jgi:hypothetical protein